MEEIWRPVKGYEGLYEVSNEGRVRSVDRIVKSPINNNPTVCRKGLILKQINSVRNCKRVNLSKNGNSCLIFVHRLVARAFPEFCGKWFEGCVINHKDENPANNKAENLEVCTAKYNSNYGTAIERRVEKQSKLINQYTLDGEFVKQWNRASEIEETIGINGRNVRNCCSGKRKSTGGYQWEYAK